MERVLGERELEEVYEILKEQTRPFWWVRRGQKKRVEKLQRQRGNF
mgnify:FL=1